MPRWLSGEFRSSQQSSQEGNFALKGLLSTSHTFERIFLSFRLESPLEMWRIEILKVLSPPVETATGPVWVLNVLQQPKVVSSQENSAFKGYLLILKTVCLGGEKIL